MRSPFLIVLFASKLCIVILALTYVFKFWLCIVKRFKASLFITTAPPEKMESPSEEEQQKKKLKEKSRKEFLAAVAAEGKRFKQTFSQMFRSSYWSKHFTNFRWSILRDCFSIFNVFFIADQGLKTRLEMIKVHACSVLQELKVGMVLWIWNFIKLLYNCF